MSSPKRHHFIPIVHLKHFADSKGQVWTYEAETGDVRPAAPENTAVQSHFYSAEGADGSMDTRIEEHLSKMESAAAPVYEALLQGKIPKDIHARADFATFLALMFVRTPAMRRMAAEMHGQLLQTHMYAYAAHDDAFETLTNGFERENGPISPEMKAELRKNMIDPSNFTMAIPKEYTFMALGAADELARIFFRMKWSLILAAQGFFLTSDNPVVRQVDRRTYHPIYGDHGFLNKTAEVTFPLSPKMMLLMTWNQSAREICALEREHVDDANRARAAHSERYLYAHIRDKRVQRLTAEFKDSRTGMTMQGFGPEKFAEITVPRRVRPRASPPR